MTTTQNETDALMIADGYTRLSDGTWLAPARAPRKGQARYEALRERLAADRARMRETPPIW